MVFRLPDARVHYPGQGTALITLPQDSQTPMPVVIAIHGAGRSALDYRDTPFYIRQQQIAREQGCLFAAISNGPDAWGTDDGLYNVECLLDYVLTHYKTASKVLLWPTSAGGVLAHRLVKKRPEQIAAVLGTFPVYDLAAEFPLLDACGQAWKVSTQEELLQKISGKNPPDFIEDLQNTPYFIAHGDEDTAVPLAKNSARLAADCGSNVHLQIIPHGQHSCQDMRYLETVPAAAFLFYKQLLGR